MPRGSFHIRESDFALFEHLSADHRAVLTTEGSYEEIAAALNIPIGTVKSRINRARSSVLKLREEPRL